MFVDSQGAVRAEPAESFTSPAAVLFDMDGTLVDSEKLWTVALDDYADTLGGAISEATRAGMVGSNMARSMWLLLTDLGLAAGEAEIREARDAVGARMSKLLATELTWRPGAREALRAVSDRGVPTGLVTSTIRPLTDIALRTIGAGAFDVTVCGDEVDGLNKPEPEPYLRACRRLSVEPGDCVAIEDSPTGVASAVAAGCTVLGVACEVPLDRVEGCVLRESLVGLDIPELSRLLADI